MQTRKPNPKQTMQNTTPTSTTTKLIGITTAISLVLTASGCATSAGNIAAGYTSPMQYQSYDCPQLAGEAQRIQARVSQLAGRLDEAASNDKALMGVGLVLFWPALSAMGGTKQQEADYARLKGEYDAISQAMVIRKCEPASAAAANPVPPAQAPSPGASASLAAPAPAPAPAEVNPAHR